MPRWQHTLQIGDLHAKYEAKEIDVKKLATEFANRLKATPYKDDLDIVLAVGMLEGAEDIEEYDEALALVYDFGDGGHRLWVDTST